jgi:hypothetical protein
MNYIKYLFLLFAMRTSCEKTIRNINVPSCKKCIHFIPAPYNFDFTTNYNRCAKFGEKDIITDKINYDFAELCRPDETKCGKEGKYFEEEENLDMKIFMHKFNYLFTFALPLSSLVILYFFILALPPIKH